MAKVAGSIQFGVRLEISLPVSVSKEKLQAFLSAAERSLTAVLSSAVTGAFRLLPMVHVRLYDAKTAITIHDVQH